MDVLLVGCGNMGSAMLRGWVTAAPDLRFHVVEPNETLRATAAEIGAETYGGADGLGDLSPALVVLAVKPQVMGEVAPDYGRFANATFASIAAGTTIASLQGWLGAGRAIVRSMPNTPAAIGRGMMVSVANDAVSEAGRSLTERLLSASGRHAWIEDEALMDAVTAISGSGPAYIFHFIECLAEAARAVGLPADLADILAMETVAGAGALAAGSEDAPGTLREKVTSPGGTTAAALGVLMGRLGPLMTEAAVAARDRGVELGKG